MAFISGTNANDTLVGTGGDDLFVGGTGADTALIASPGATASYQFVAGQWRVTSQAGVDTLDGVEFVAFSDGTVRLGVNEGQVNTTTLGVQAYPVLTALGNGYVVTWVSVGQDGDGYGLYSRHFDASGAAVGGEIQVNTYTASDQYDAAVSALGDGGYVVTWNSFGQDGSADGVYARRFDGTGAAVGGEIQVNTATLNRQWKPAVSALADGGYLIAWEGTPGIFSQRYAAAGTPIGGEVQITPVGTSAGSPAVTALEGGGYFITWVALPYGGPGTVQSQRFDAAGAKTGSQVQISTASVGSQSEPSLTMLEGGGWVVKWQGSDNNGAGILSRTYDAAGVALGPETVVNLTTESGQGSRSQSVAALPDGGYVVTWSSAYQDGSAFGVYSRRYDASGSALTGEIQVNTSTAGDQYDPTISALPDGGYVIAWTSTLQDGSGSGVYAQRFAADGTRVGSALGLEGNAQGNVLDWAGTASVVLRGHEGNDTLVGGAGNDTLQGGEGSDIVVMDVATNSVTWSLAAGVLRLQGGAQTDVLDSVEAVEFNGATIQVSYHVADVLLHTSNAGSRGDPALAGLATGGYVSAWTSTADGSDPEIYTRVFDGTGAPLTGEIHVNTITAGSQFGVCVAVLSGGGYVVSWTCNTAGGQEVRARQFNSEGVAVSAEVLIHSRSGGNSSNPAVTALADGGYVLTWESYGSDGNATDVYARRFDAAGAAMTPVTLVNTTTTSGFQNTPSVASLSDGGYVVTWTSNFGDADNFDVYARRFDATGTAVAADMRVNSTLADGQINSVVTGLAGGGYIVTWVSYLQDGVGYGIFSRRFDGTDTPVSGEVQVNTIIAGHQMSPAVSSLADGGYVVTWVSGDGNSDGIFARRYDAQGDAIGGETQVNTYANGTQTQPAVTALADGGYIVAWTSPRQDAGGLGSGVYSQRYDVNGLAEGHLTLSGDGGHNALRLTAADQGAQLNGGAGNDTLAGAQVNDVLTGGTGADVFEFKSASNGRDVIADWAYGDAIDIASANMTGAVTVGDGSAVGLNQVQMHTAGGSTFLHIGTDATAGADITVQLAGTWTPADFSPYGTRILGAVNVLPTGAVTIAGTTTQGQSLTAANTLSDDDGLGTIGYQWLADGNEIAGATGSTLQLTQATVGAAISVVASYRDGEGHAESVSSLPTAIVQPPLSATLTGTAGADTLLGGDGADVIFGLAATDVLDGRAGSDIYLVALSSQHGAAEFADSGASGSDEVRFTATSSGTLTLFSGDTGIERVVIGTGTGTDAVRTATTALSVQASAAPNALSITGNAGVNTLTGTVFNDTLDGGAGADRLVGGNGNDTYIVDNAKDVVTEASAAAGTDQVQAFLSYTLLANVENLVLAGTAAINGTGNTLSNTITGNAAANVLDGKSGLDQLDGADGSDVYLVGLAADHPGAEFADTGAVGIDEVRFAATKAGALTLSAGDTGIERVVIGTGTGATAVSTATTALNVNAAAVANALTMSGNAGANSLTGTAFNDTLIGGAGADTLIGNGGDDVLSGGNGSDTLTGGAGADRFVFNVAPNASSNKDTLVDFQSGIDLIQLSAAIFPALGAGPGTLDAARFWSDAAATGGHDVDDRIVYNSTTGALYYDADGNGAGAAVQIALIGALSHPAIAFSDLQIIA